MKTMLVPSEILSKKRSNWTLSRIFRHFKYRYVNIGESLILADILCILFHYGKGVSYNEILRVHRTHFSERITKEALKSLYLAAKNEAGYLERRGYPNHKKSLVGNQKKRTVVNIYD